MAALLSILPSLLLSATPAVARAPDSASTDLGEFFAEWCSDCHGGARPKAELDLEQFAEAERGSELLRDLKQRLETGEMPPPGFAAPAPEAREAAVAALAEEIRRRVAATPPDPGRVTMRRLSRFEYQRTVRDLLGVHVPLDSFPADDLGYGFDHIGDVLTLSPLLLEKYADAAEFIAEQAIVAEDPSRAPRWRLEAEEMSSSLDRSARGDRVVLYTSGEVASEVELPRDGEYRLRARASGDQAGAEAPGLAVRVDGNDLGVLDVPQAAGDWETFELSARLQGGRRRFALAFLNDHYEPDHPDPKQRDRNLHLDWLEIHGPLDSPPLPAAHRRIFAGDDPSLPVAERAHRLLAALLPRAWRRPVSAAEGKRLVALVEEIVARGELFERGMQIALQAILLSPHFLFLAEPVRAPPPSPIDPDPSGPPLPPVTDVEEALGDYELASRLSYFLWSSMPDDELLARAAEGRLNDPEEIRRQVRRMLRDPRASALAENFAAQWLELRNLEAAQPDPDRFPAWGRELRVAMRREAELFFEAVLREGRPARELLAADFTFANESLARLYGFPGVQGASLRRVPVAGTGRGGLLGMAAILAVTSDPTRTSPVKRGKWILDNLLDSPPPPPPPGAGSLDDSAEAIHAASLRERLEQHRRDPTCASCHARMDPLGFALENFDPLGRWRETDAGFPIDASGTLPDGRGFDGPEELKDVLEHDPAFLRCVTRKLFVYALGRGVEEADEAALDRLVESLPAEASLEDAIQGIAGLDALRRRRAAVAPAVDRSAE